VKPSAAPRQKSQTPPNAKERDQNSEQNNFARLECRLALRLLGRRVLRLLVRFVLRLPVRLVLRLLLRLHCRAGIELIIRKYQALCVC
jgi:hypothetical protein